MQARIAALVAAVAVLVVALLVYLGRQAPAPPESTPVDAVATDASRAPSSATPADAPAPEPSASVPRPRRDAAAVTEAPPPAEPAAPAVEVAPTTGSLRIESDVPGAQVFIDRQFVGAAPVTAENLRPGTHQLNVSAEGFDGVARTVDVAPGAATVTVRFREVRLDEKLAVVHKHRMGSCAGTLTATPAGLRYETADKDDQFTVPFADLEVFQVDYAEKNLRVKPRKGRQFNFTDPEGNADRLFVFHRDVDKARQRLARGDAPGD